MTQKLVNNDPSFLTIYYYCIIIILSNLEWLGEMEPSPADIGR